MMKRTLKLLAILATLMFLVSCGSSGSSPEDLGEGGNGAGPTPSGDTTQITVGIPYNPCPPGVSCLVTPGVPPGTISTFGTIESRVCYEPWTCAVPRTGQVVGGVLNISYTVPVNTYLHIGYILDNQLRFDGITINGTPLANLAAPDGTPTTNYGVLGTAPNQWGVSCFIVNRDQVGAITVSGNTQCDEAAYRLRIRVTGDNNANGAYDAPFDDTLVPLTGAQAGEEYRFQTSLWEVPSPGGVWQQLVWDPTTTSYSETFYSVLSGMSAWFTVHNPCRDPLAPPGCYEPRIGVWADVMPIGGGAVQCQSLLVHYEDLDPAGLYWQAALIDGINTGTNCVIQGADTRGVIVSGP